MAMKCDRFNCEGLVGLFSSQYVQLPLALLFLIPQIFFESSIFLTEVIDENFFFKLFFIIISFWISFRKSAILSNLEVKNQFGVLDGNFDLLQRVVGYFLAIILKSIAAK